MTVCLPVLGATRTLEISRPERLAQALAEEVSSTADMWVAIDGGLSIPLSSVGVLSAGDHDVLLIERSGTGELLDTRWLRVEVSEAAAGTPFVFAPRWTVDRSPPRLLARQKPLVIGRNGRVSVSAVDPLGVASVRYRIDGRSWEQTALDNSRPVRVELSFEDAGGNSGRETFDAMLDVDPPTIDLWMNDEAVADGDVLVLTEDAVFRAEGVDQVSAVEGVYWRTDGARWRPASEPWTLFDTGAQWLEVKAVDSGGNATTRQWELTWD